MPRVKTSPVYNFYELTDTHAQCKECSTKITSISSANLEKHLRTFHVDKFKELELLKSVASNTSTPKRKLDPKQPALSFEPPPKKELPPAEVSRLNKEAILIGATPSFPLDVVKKHQSMMRHGYNAPGPKKLRKMILAFSSELLKNMRVILSKDCSKCMVLDIWSDRSKSSFLGATIHTVDNNFASECYFVGVYLMKNGTTNDQVKVGTIKLLERVGLSMEDIDFFVTDNGSNMLACFKSESKHAFLDLSKNLETAEFSDYEGIGDELDSNATDEQSSDEESDSNAGISEELDCEDETNEKLDCQLVLPRHFTCIDHTLELVTKKVIDQSCKSDSIGTTLRNVRKLISSIRKSVKQKREIHAQTGYLPLFFASPRWSGNFIMIDRLLSVEGMIEAVNKAGAALNAKSAKTVRTLNGKDVGILKDLHALLKPFHATIMKLQQDKDFTSLHVYGDLMELLEHTSSFKSIHTDIVSAAKLLHKELNIRFEKFLVIKQGSIPAYIVSSLLDVSKGFLLQDMSKNNLIQLLRNELESVNSEAVEFSATNIVQPIIEKVVIGKFAQRMLEKQRMIEQVNFTSDSCLSIAKGFVEFSLSSDIQVSAKVYWKDAGVKQFPLIAPIARKYFCLQATSGSIERGFSHAGIATAGRKNKTSDKLLDAKLLIHLNSSIAKAVVL